MDTSYPLHTAKLLKGLDEKLSLTGNWVLFPGPQDLQGDDYGVFYI
jgi:hypothetical protein